MKFALVSNLVAFGTCALAMVASEKKQNHLARTDIILGKSGNYQFVNCNPQQGGLIGPLLQTLKDTLLPVIHDAKGSKSHRSTAYEFFLKDQSQARFVANLITNVTIGNARYPAEPPFSNGNPTFICATPGLIPLSSPDGKVQDAYDRCLGRVIATYLDPTPWIVLCPLFFRLPSHPPSDACPTVNRHSTHFNRKPIDDTIAGSSIWQNKIWVLFHELVHYYLHAQPGYEALGPGEEVYNINKAWRLSPAGALQNAENYVYYAYTVSANCTKWPTLPENERELLEGWDVGPDLVDGEHAAIEDVVNVTSARVMEANQINACRR